MIFSHSFPARVLINPGHLPIGHAYRPTAFSRTPLSNNDSNENCRNLSAFWSKPTEDVECTSTISSEIVRMPALQTTPSFNPGCSDFTNQKESKDDIIAEFMAQLEGPTCKNRNEKMSV